METNELGHAYKAVRYIYDKSPGRSWRRLNGALSETLRAAITAHLSFTPDDFEGMYAYMSGGYWMGDGGISHLGERYYDLAVECGHTPACLSFEKWAGRPPALWAEDVKTPERLHAGSRFTWQGLLVTVTSMKTEYLVACTYRDDPHERGGIAVGSVRYYDDYRKAEVVKELAGGKISLRLSAKCARPDPKPERIFKITYEDLAAARKEQGRFLKTELAKIAAASTLPEIDVYVKSVAASFKELPRYLREALQDAVHARQKAINEKKVA